MLKELARNGSPQPYSASYAPLVWLVAAGMATQAEGKYGSSRFSITKSGRAILRVEGALSAVHHGSAA